MLAAILDLMPLDNTPEETPVSVPHVICNSDAIHEISKLENCITEASDEMTQNSLKTEDSHSLTGGHNYIKFSYCIKILDATLTLKLTDLHICAYVRYETFFMQFFSDNADKTLVQPVVISRLDYCNGVCVLDHQ